MGSRGLGVFGVDEGGRGLMESRIGGGRSQPWIHGVMEGFAEKPQGKIKKKSCPSFTICFKRQKSDRQEEEIKHNDHPADHNQQMAGFSRNCLFTRFPLLIKTVCWGFYRERGLTKAADAVPPVIPPLQLQCNHDP